MDISPTLSLDEKSTRHGTDWVNLGFMLALHLAAIVGPIIYLQSNDFAWRHAVFGLAGFVVTTLAISTGYHRLFAHRTYETGRVLKVVWLFFGAAAFQTSALQWSRKHRTHHQHLDGPRDPYDATKGLWHSHMGWVLRVGRPHTADDSDLMADPLVRFQHRHFVAIAATAGFLLPTAIGFAFNDPWGGFLFGGVCRLVAVYHATFSINSLAHWIGRQPYSTDNTARDSWVTALLTMGEGYHNFHHTFPGDYRNGVRPFDFDPPKWLLLSMARLRLVRNLRRTPGHLVALRRLRTDKERLANLSLSVERRGVLVQRADGLRLMLGAWATAHAQDTARSRASADAQTKRREFWREYNAWRVQLSD
jgi:stearoyl-CoA desaturase (Delta-9 desaturase)